MADVALRVANAEARTYGDLSEFDVWCAFAGADLRAYPQRNLVAVGAPPVTVSPSSIASAEAFGTATIALTVQPAGIASAEALGAPTIGISLSPAGIASAEAFGLALLGLAISVSAIASGEAFGTAAVSVDVTVVVGGIASGEAFGTATIADAAAAATKPHPRCHRTRPRLRGRPR